MGDAPNDLPHNSPVESPQATGHRNLLVEIVGITASMAAGAFPGLQAGGNGLGFVGFIVLCSLMGCVAWLRRQQSFLGTVGIWLLMLAVGWPLCGILRIIGQ